MRTLYLGKTLQEMGVCERSCVEGYLRPYCGKQVLSRLGIGRSEKLLRNCLRTGFERNSDVAHGKCSAVDVCVCERSWVEGYLRPYCGCLNIRLRAVAVEIRGPSRAILEPFLGGMGSIAEVDDLASGPLGAVLGSC